ncbi:MAG: TolC family protein, partial [Planctomycetota bacterium]
AILKQQEQQILLDLSNACSEVDRAYMLFQTNYNRHNAARERLEAVQAAFEADKATPDQVLEAQRFLADAQSGYYLSRVEYAIAVKNIHLEKGSLTDYYDVYLAGDSWSAESDPTMGGKLQIPRPRWDALFGAKPTSKWKYEIYRDRHQPPGTHPVPTPAGYPHGVYETEEFPQHFREGFSEEQTGPAEGTYYGPSADSRVGPADQVIPAHRDTGPAPSQR